MLIASTWRDEPAAATRCNRSHPISMRGARMRMRRRRRRVGRTMLRWVRRMATATTRPAAGRECDAAAMLAMAAAHRRRVHHRGHRGMWDPAAQPMV